MAMRKPGHKTRASVKKGTSSETKKPGSLNTQELGLVTWKLDE